MDTMLSFLTPKVFTNTQPRVFVYYLLVAVLTLANTYIFKESSQHGWLILSALLFSFVLVGERFLQRLLTVFVTGIASACLVLVFSFLPQYYGLSLVIVAAFTVVLVYQRTIVNKYSYPLLVLNLMILLAACMPGAGNDIAFRFVFILQATLIVLMSQCIFGWHYRQFLEQSLQQQLFYNLAALTKAIFSTFINVDYQNTFYLYEHRIHRSKNACMQNLLAARHHVPAITMESNDALFSLLLACGQLRMRVTDHSVFEICKPELLKIAENIENSLIHFQQVEKRTSFLSMLAQEINALEQSYLNVLQVTAPEPFVFFLFIENLKSIQQLLEQLTLLSVGDKHAVE